MNALESSKFEENFNFLKAFDLLLLRAILLLPNLDHSLDFFNYQGWNFVSPKKTILQSFEDGVIHLIYFWLEIWSRGLNLFHSPPHNLIHVHFEDISSSCVSLGLLLIQIQPPHLIPVILKNQQKLEKIKNQRQNRWKRVKWSVTFERVSNRLS